MKSFLVLVGFLVVSAAHAGPCALLEGGKPLRAEDIMKKDLNFTVRDIRALKAQTGLTVTLNKTGEAWSMTARDPNPPNPTTVMNFAISRVEDLDAGWIENYSVYVSLPVKSGVAAYGTTAVPGKPQPVNATIYILEVEYSGRSAELLMLSSPPEDPIVFGINIGDAAPQK